MTTEFAACPKEKDQFGSDVSDTSSARWVLELDDRGTVIYSHPHHIENAAGAVDLKGRNFFEDFEVFDDVTTYKQNFQSFINSRRAVASFVWQRNADNGSGKTRVLMTRAFETGYRQPTGVVMMELKDC